MMGNWGWLILAVVLAGVEIFAPGACFIWLAAAAGATGAIAFLMPGLDWDLQMLVFAVAAILSIVFWRAYQKNAAPRLAGTLNRRGAALIGRRAVLVQAIASGRGKARIDDTVWTVCGPDLDAGATIVVTGCDGSILSVEAADGR